MRLRALRTNQKGEINILTIPLVLTVVLFVAAAGFGVWAFNERQHYKEDTDAIVADKVDEAKKLTIIEKDKLFAEEEKKPNTTYDGPSAYGSVKITYPKTWSVYVHSNVSNPQPLDAFFNPRTVPSVIDQGSVYALRIKVVQTPYAQVVKTYTNLIKSKGVTSQPFALAKVPDVVGIRFDGQVVPQKKLNGAMVVFPLRDKTLQIWTENAQSMNDFNNIILPQMSFVP